MNPYDHQPFEEPADDELAAALDVLKSLSQSTVAFEIGISERRFRDIEYGRSRPRRKNREAILRLADSVRSGGPDRRVVAESSTESNHAAAGEQPSVFWLIVIIALFLGGLVALIYLASQQPE